MMNDNNSQRNLRDPNQVAWHQSLVGRLAFAFILVAVVPLIVGGVWSLITMQQANAAAIQQSETAMIELGATAVFERAKATADQIALYLETHPELDLTDAAQLQNDLALAEIAVQPVGQTGYTAVFDESAITHFHVNPNTVGLDMSTLSERFPDFWAIFAASLDGSLADGYYDWEDEDGVIRSKFMSVYPVGDTRLRVASTTYIDEFSQPVVELSSQLTDVQEKARNQFLIILAGTVLVAAGSATVLSRQFSSPIRQITEATRHVATGGTVPIGLQRRTDEIGNLARSFQETSGQLQETLTRVERRNRVLEVNTEVSRNLSSMLDQEQLTAAVVNQVQSAFNYYHAHIYLLNETGDTLRMVGGTGEAGAAMRASGHTIPVGKGLVGRAAATNETVLVSDVSQVDGWLPNPLLPETKAEVAVPIALGDKVLGVLDVQHNVVGGLRQLDAEMLQTVAAQVAIALRNATLYEQAQRQSAQQTLVNEISQKVHKAVDMDSVLQVTAQELGRSLGVRRATVQLSGQRKDNGRIQEKN